MNPVSSGPASRPLPPREVLRRVFFGNLGTKLMALALAFMLWLYLYATERDNRVFAVVFDPGIAAGADFRDQLYVQYWAVYPGSNGEDRRGGRPLEPGDELEISLFGPRTEMDRLKNLVLRPEFSEDDFQSESSGFPHRIEGIDLGLDKSFSVTGGPQEDRVIAIEVEYQKIGQREVVVLADKSDLVGKPAEGFEIRDVRVVPEKIRVLVPVNEEVKEVRIGKIPVDGASETFQLGIPIRHDYDFPVRTDPGQLLTAKVSIVPKESKKILELVKLRIDGPPDQVGNIELSPGEITVTVTGPVRLMEKIEAGHLFISVPIDFTLSEQDPLREVDALNLRHYFRIPEVIVDNSLLRVEFMSDKEDAADRKVEVKYVKD